jgi:NodT family efflux transporter outer membrane factor (OMF) lipoprotein
MNKKYMQIQLSVLILLLITACAVGPEYRRPKTIVDQVESFQNAPDNVQQVLAAGTFNHWWRNMDDPWLNNAVNSLLEDNLQLKEAAARVQQAWAQLGIARGSQLPSLSISGSAARVGVGVDATSAFSSRNFGNVSSGQPGQTGNNNGVTAGAASTGSGSSRIYFTQLEAGISTSWQVDLFGKLERSTAVARLNYLASLVNAEALIHSLIAELARRRISQATLQQRIKLAEETVESRNLTLKIVERRYRRGIADTATRDVYLARENMAAAASRIPNLKSQLSEQFHLVDVLLGLPPGTTTPDEINMPQLPPPDAVSVGLPARLIDNRPDLRGNELRMAAGVERIGVAVADLYPDLTLTGSVGFQNDELSGFFNSTNLVGSIIGDIMVRLFDGGRLRAGIDLREAEARELAAAYAGDVLTALEEVETALSNDRYFAAQIDLLEDRLKNIRKAAQLLEEQYQRGLVSLLDVLVTERRRYEAEQEYLVTAQAAWNNRIALYLALGGDWFDRQLNLKPMRVPWEEQ